MLIWTVVSPVYVQVKNGERVFHVIEHTPEALDIWLKALNEK